MPKRIAVVFGVVVAVLATGVITDIAYSGWHHRGSIPIDWRVSGTIVGIKVEPLAPTGYSGPAFLIDAFLAGAPGRAQFRVLAAVGGPPEIIPECLGDGVNPDGVYFAFDDMVIIFEDLSMLFAKMDPDLRGWQCFTGEPAVANMEIIGGTGRYQGARGEYQAIFGGYLFGDSQALIAEFGTIKGFIER